MSDHPDPLTDFTNRIAIVTGASRGIGRAIAMGLAARGATVIVSSRKLDGCQSVVDEIISEGGKAEAFACHIGDIDQIESLFSFVENSYGRLDMLVNNAATNPYFGHIADTDLSAFQKTVDVNIRGFFFMSAQAVQMMRKAGSGSIVNIASVNGVVPGLFQGIYSITKAAVISMTEAFAKECGPEGIRVNAVLPGLTETKFAAALLADKEMSAAVKSTLPLRRSAQPVEMVGAVIYLLSDAASYTTGSSLKVDGGYLLQ